MNSASQQTRAWTDEQSRAIHTVDHSLLVSAAAGSGKTAVLSERCAYLVCEAPNPCDVDKLLVVTFTKLAATEMRTRIEKALRARVDPLGEEADPRLLRQLTLLDRTSIGTLHSFCTSVLREHFQAIGLDPSFTLLDEDQARLLRLETARTMFSEKYDGEDSAAFHRLVDNYGDGEDEPLLEQMLSTYDLLCSVVDQDGWRKTAIARLEEAAKLPLAKSQLGKSLIEQLTQTMATLLEDAQHAMTRLSRMGRFPMYVEYVGELLATLREWNRALGKGSYSALADAVRGWKTPKAPSVSNDIPGKDAARALVDSIRIPMGPKSFLGTTLKFTETEWKESVDTTIVPARMFLKLVEEFRERFTSEKSKQHWLDFNDLERLTMKVLEGPSLAARMYHKRFDHVLVDEYQDINEVQDRILFLVSKECLADEFAGTLFSTGTGNLFCVGDVKQSIYRFRLAEPQRFQQRADRFRGINPQGGTVIDLRTNFRSRGPLLGALNGLFERLMTKDAMEIQYDQTHRLNPPVDSPYLAHPVAPPPVELHVLPVPGNDDLPVTDNADDDGFDRTEAEAAFVAQKIKDLIADPTFTVLGKSGDTFAPRPAQHGDIAVLLRSLAFKADAFAKILRKAGIPVHYDSRTGFFESVEVQDVLSLLAVLDNLRQDIPLAAVLRSPLMGLSNADDLLARIRLSQPDQEVPFHLAALQFDDPALKHALAQLKAWREMANQRPLAETLWHIFTQSGYLTFCSGLPDGDQRVANLLELHKRAVQFSQFARLGLGRFRQFLETLQEESDAGQPSVAVEGADTVRLMSVHGSKGLEFPVVFVADLGKKHSSRSQTGLILVDRNAYIGMSAVDEEKRIRYPSLAKVLASGEIRRRSLAEEMRILYVAATRAREKLFLVGTSSNKGTGEWKERWSTHTGPIPAGRLLAASTPLDWLGPAATALSAISPELIGVHLHEEAVPQVAGAPRQVNELRETLAQLKPLDPPPTIDGESRQLLQRLQTPYEFEPFTREPAARSVTSIAAQEQHQPAPIVLTAPQAVEIITELSPTEIGDATHLLLEHVDFAGPCSSMDLRELGKTLIAGRFMTKTAMDAIDFESICWFMESELGRLMRAHARVLRKELPLYFPIGDAPDPLDRAMARGRIDVLIPLADRSIIIDYKTDRIGADAAKMQAEHHRPQLALYCNAIAAVTMKPVEAHLAFLTPRMCAQVI